MSDNHSHNNNETTQITRSRSNSKSKSKSKSKNNSKKSESKSKTNVFFESFMKLSSMAWLNIIADCMHNFTDGLALGGIGGTPTILAIFTTIFVETYTHDITYFSHSYFLTNCLNNANNFCSQFYLTILDVERLKHLI
jgi:hypothetical protein